MFAVSSKDERINSCRRESLQPANFVTEHMKNTATILDRYVSRSMGTVQGYLTSLDARLVAALLSCQDEGNIAGHLCEIGVHHGKLFLMLALARRPGERSLAIDLF